MTDIDRVIDITNGDILTDTHTEYNGYEFVLGEIRNLGGLSCCYVFPVENADSRKQELDAYLPTSTTQAIVDTILGWDYGTFGTYVDVDERIGDCKDVINQLCTCQNQVMGGTCDREESHEGPCSRQEGRHEQRFGQ